MRLSVEIQEMLRQTGFMRKQSVLANTSRGGYHFVAVSVVINMSKDLHNFLHIFTIHKMEWPIND